MNNGFMLNMEKYIIDALKEDINNEDISTNSIIRQSSPGKVQLIAKEDGILCGLDVFFHVFYLLDNKARFDTANSDGARIKKGDVIGTLYAGMDALLSGERTALNYLQRMSGIATTTRVIADMLSDTKIKIVDTRKTAPNLRIFDKYSVKVGGGLNHRYNLSDGIMLKDNHITAAGGIKKAVAMVREYATFVDKIEVETENLAMVKEALEAEVEIIMLDNMTMEEMKEAIRLINHKALIEVSGNVTVPRIKELKTLDIDFISCGSLTHSVQALDISMKNLTAI